MSSSRLPDAKSAKEQASLVKKQLKCQKRIENAKLKELEEERKRILEAAANEAANECFYLQLLNPNPELVNYFKDLGFVVADRKEIRRLIKPSTSFYTIWKEQYLPKPDLQGVLQPLHDFLFDNLMRTLGKSKSVAEINEIVLEILKSYYQDIENRNDVNLLVKLERIQEFEYIFEPISAIDLKPDLTLDFTKSELGQLLGKFKFQGQTRDLVKISQNICWQIYSFDEHWENLEQRIEENLFPISATYDNAIFLTWFLKPFVHDSLTYDLSQAFFWLATESGQAVLEDIYDGIEKAVGKGSFRFELDLSSSIRSCMEVINLLITQKGYLIDVKEVSQSTFKVQISWSK